MGIRRPRLALAGLLSAIVLYGTIGSMQPTAFAVDIEPLVAEHVETDTRDSGPTLEGSGVIDAAQDGAGGSVSDTGQEGGADDAASIPEARTTGPTSSRGTERRVDWVGDSIASVALSYVGYPYRYGGASPWGFDCSGLVLYVLNQHGIRIGRTTYAQWGYGVPVSLWQARPGDLVFFANTYTTGISHVGIYIGNGYFVDAQSERTGVRINSLYSAYWSNHFAGARRVR